MSLVLGVRSKITSPFRSFLARGAKILDLGAAPGSWSQYALRKTKGKARIIAIDLLDIEPIENESAPL